MYRTYALALRNRDEAVPDLDSVLCFDHYLFNRPVGTQEHDVGDAIGGEDSQATHQRIAEANQRPEGVEQIPPVQKAKAKAKKKG